jgi:hypothetical protein
MVPVKSTDHTQFVIPAKEAVIAAFSAMEPRHLGVQIDAYDVRQGAKCRRPDEQGIGAACGRASGAPTPFPALSLPVPCWHTRQGKFFPC